MNDTKLDTLANVREYVEGDPVELWRNENGRIVIRAYNEGGYNCTEIDLNDLLNWAKLSRWIEHDRT